MGVPGFFRWLMQKGKEFHWKEKMVREEIYDEEDADWLLLDTNGLLHPCCLRVLEEQENNAELEVLMLEEIVTYLNKLVNLVNPVKGVMIAIDGVAPAAKMKQQRQRRFKASINPNEWSNSAISPGTEFMEKVHKRIITWAETYRESFPSDWPESERREERTIIYSSYKTPMEGEHKLVQFIRDNNSSEETKDLHYVIYGLDADLFFLTMALGNANMFLLREEQQTKITRQRRMDVGEFMFVKKQFVIQQNNYVRSRRNEIVTDADGFQANNERLIRDFILICFLLGNDFVPHLPALNIYSGGVDTLLRNYARLILKYNCERFIIASPEEHLTPENIIDIDPIRLGQGKIEEWKDRYYSYYGISRGADANQYLASIDEVCENYLEGLKFISLYYFRGCPSWEWLYVHDFPPFLSDIQSFIARREFQIRDVTFDLGAPVSPFEQLMSILPADKAYMLPEPCALLMTNSLCSLGALIPRDYTQDLYGKDKFWQAVPLLPRMNLRTVKEAYAHVVGIKMLTDVDMERNTPCEELRYRNTLR
eukprot:GSChrysophyteH1.ASY1.ANO1.1314.1 assembled CDS